MTPESKNRQYLSSIGKRKTAIARVKLYPEGSGEVTVNGMKMKDYFDTPMQRENALAPLVLIDKKNAFDIEAVIVGGGKTGHSDALRHAISRVLLLVNPDVRSDLKRAGFLRRDARIKERKKPGLKRARRAPQWQKR
jgi:small subunit ribosomal protein S9